MLNGDSKLLRELDSYFCLIIYIVSRTTENIIDWVSNTNTNYLF
jgi:hypothetical protein